MGKNEQKETMWKWQGWKGAGHSQGFLEVVQVESLQDRLAPRDFGWDVVLTAHWSQTPWPWERQQWNYLFFPFFPPTQWTKAWSVKPTRWKEITEPRKLFPVLHICDLGCEHRYIDISTHVHTHLSKYMNRKKK